MKPTEQQLTVLKDYLHKTLTYRETYAEIYDHILSAIEHQPENILFEDAINNIIRDDFGGAKNLLKIEKAGKDALVKQTINTFMEYWKYYFTLPGVLYTVVFALLTYYFFSRMNLQPVTVFEIFAIVVLFPGVIWFLRLYYTGYVLGTTRKSAKDKLFENMGGILIRIGLAPLAIMNLFNYKIWSGNNYYLITLFFVLGVSYNVALYKLYRSEFKTTALAK